MSVFSRETEPTGCVCVCMYFYIYLSIYLSTYPSIHPSIRGRVGGHIYFNELGHVMVEAGKSKICRVGWQAGDPGKSLKAGLCQNSFLLKGGPSVSRRAFQ